MAEAIKTETSQPPVPVLVVPARSLAERERQVHEEIARRAYEIFESRGCQHGRDVDDWFQAEAQLLHRLPHRVAQTQDRLFVFADLARNWAADELVVGVGAHRLIISGEREVEMTYHDPHGTRTEKHLRTIFQALDLPVEVRADGATATLAGTTLEIVMPRRV